MSSCEQNAREKGLNQGITKDLADSVADKIAALGFPIIYEICVISGGGF
jgi:hypothetical protein